MLIGAASRAHNQNQRDHQSHGTFPGNDHSGAANGVRGGCGHQTSLGGLITAVMSSLRGATSD
ncbi:Uncharacterised protein [Mycobacteroides abscessus subsp. abscessus]|nr:Uncharacterised protein [Mycobacteroides abscessus subsp. abscessus]